MKKHKKILIGVILFICVAIITILIYNKWHYSKDEILAIINRSSETFDNIYIKIESDRLDEDEIFISEYYAKDNIIYTDSYTRYPSLDDTIHSGSEIWNLNTKEKILLNHRDKTIYVDTIRGKRIS